MTAKRKGQARRAKWIAAQWESAKRRAALLEPGAERDEAHREAQRLEAQLRNYMERMARNEPKQPNRSANQCTGLK